jgi:small-conductance mechanosensitive channel
MDIHKKLNPTFINNNKGYFSKYGVDLIIAVIIIYFFAITTMYFFVLNHIPKIREKWSKEKCNPLYMPFAGLVVKNSKKTNNQLVEENFHACIINILTSITQDALKPIYYANSVATKTMQDASNATQAIRAFFNRIRTDFQDTAENIYGRGLNITLPFVKMVLIMRNTLGQIHSLFTTALYVTMGSYMTLYSAIMNIINIIIMVILLALGLSILAVIFIPFVGQAIAAPSIALFVAIVAFLMPVVYMMNDVFKSPSIAKPKAPP